MYKDKPLPYLPLSKYLIISVITFYHSLRLSVREMGIRRKKQSSGLFLVEWGVSYAYDPTDALHRKAEP